MSLEFVQELLQAVAERLSELRHLSRGRRSRLRDLERQRERILADLSQDLGGGSTHATWPSLPLREREQLLARLSSVDRETSQLLAECLEGAVSTYQTPTAMADESIRALVVGCAGATAGVLLLLCMLWTGSSTGEEREHLRHARAQHLQAVNLRDEAARTLNELNAKAPDGAEPSSSGHDLQVDQWKAISAERESVEREAALRLRDLQVRLELSAPSEGRVLLTMILLGTLGSLLHGLASLSTFLGNRQLQQSWATYYVLLPLRGAALAVLVYLIVRAGLLTATAPEDVNYFGLYAMGAMAGLFAKKATEKLAELFSTLFVTKSKEADPLREVQRRSE